MSELTNLLPQNRVRAFRRRYFLRLAVVSLLLFGLLAVAHSVLLLPSYFYSQGQVAHEQEELARINQSAQTTEEQQVKARGAALSTTAGELGKLGQEPAASPVLRAVLAVPHAGIALSGFTFSSPSTASTTAKMGVSGVATSRDALRAYAAALGGLPFVQNADLPISAYAKESSIPFTISLTGTLKP